MNPLPEETNREGQAQKDPTIPDTRAPEPGTSPAAGRVSPAEKVEPSGVPLQEHQHNTDPNAPQSEVVPPGQTQTNENKTGGVAATSLDQSPEVGSEEARRDEQVPNIPPPRDAGEGSSDQSNDPLESSPISS